MISGVSRWKVADEEIGVLGLSSSLSLVSLGVDGRSNFLAALDSAVEGRDGLLSVGWSVQLDVTESSALTCLVDFEFAGLDNSVWGEKVGEALLGDFLGKVFNNNVSFGVEVAILLPAEHDVSSINNSVVHFSKTSFCFVLAVEIEVSESSQFFSLSVSHDLGAGDLEFVAGEELVQVEVVGLLRQATDAQTEGRWVLALWSWLLSILHPKAHDHWTDAHVHCSWPGSHWESEHALSSGCRRDGGTSLRVGRVLLLLSVRLTGHASSLVVELALPPTWHLVLLLLHENLLLLSIAHLCSGSSHVLLLWESLLTLGLLST